jgi:Tol biopolymer transport system component/DNA-binding winged helix-turn-helix (wHTH) protein
MASQLVDMIDNGRERIRFGPFEADVHTHELWKQGIRIKLVGQPFEILALLLKKPGQLVTREELRAHLWPADTFVDFNHGLNAAINKLRDTLCDSADNPRYIETLPRRGYRFVAIVERISWQESWRPQLGAPEPSPTSNATGSGERQDSAQELAPETLAVAGDGDLRRKRTIRLPITVPVLLILAALFLTTLFNLFHKSHQAVVGRRPPMSSTPLTNLADPTRDPAFSPDGTRVAFRRQGYVEGNSGIFVKTIGSQQLLQLTSNPGDCCPAWSPNGRLIAFSRFSDKREIFTVASGGAGLHKLYTTSLSTRHGELDWSPDGNFIALVGESPQGTSSIFFLSMASIAHRITQPAPLERDWGPAFSPDGQTLAFIRTHESGLPEKILLMPTAGGESRTVVTFYNGILGSPAWTADGQSIVFSSGVEPKLLRAPAFGAGRITQIDDAGSPASHPAIARNKYRLAYQKGFQAMSIWELDLTGRHKTNSHGLIVTESGRNEGAEISPDGKKVAFMSNRSGSMETWVSDRDGSNPYQVTAMAGTGTPRWSPNSRSIAFDVGWRDRGAVFVVNVPGGVPRPLAQDNSDNLVPNWSRDGEWIYFASDRTGIWQIWKAPARGGPAVQVTTHGGFAAYPSWDGKSIYYSKLNLPDPEIWRLSLPGGLETRIPQVRPADWASWAPAEKGIYFISKDNADHAEIMFFDFASSGLKKIAGLDKLPFWLSVSPEGKSLLYEHLDQENSHIMVMNNFQ